jgi:type I restriction enzyme S subunit
MTWQTVKVCDLGQVVTGDTPPKNRPEYYGSAYPFIKPTDMQIGHRYTYSYEESYSEEAFEKYRKKLIPSGATAVVTIGSIGQKLTLTHADCFVNQAVNAIIPNSLRFDSLYVYYLLRHNLHLVKRADTGASSGRENVSKSNFSALELVATLDRDEQKRIAAVLDGYDCLIETNRRRIALLEESARLLYREWFVNLRFPGYESATREGTLPDGWNMQLLNEVAEVNRTSLSSKSQPNEIQYVDIASVETGVVLGATKMLFAEAPGRARRLVQHGDVIWSCVRPNRRSYALMWQPDDDIVVSTGFAVLSAKSVPFSYLYFATTSDDFVAYLTNRATGAAYPAVTASDFEEAPLLCPTSDVLQDFHERCLPMLELRNTLIIQNGQLTIARDALLPKLMSGAIKV